VHAPDGSGAKLAALVVFHAGDPEAAERELAPFKAFGSPVMVEIGEMPYPAMNRLLDAGFPEGALNYWLSSFTRGLPDALIDTAVERFATVPSPMTSILFEHFHGAVTRVGPGETAVPHREPGWNLLVPSLWTDRPRPTPTSAGLARRSPRCFATRRWLNYLGDDQGRATGGRRTGRNEPLRLHRSTRTAASLVGLWPTTTALPPSANRRPTIYEVPVDEDESPVKSTRRRGTKAHAPVDLERPAVEEAAAADARPCPAPNEAVFPVTSDVMA